MRTAIGLAMLTGFALSRPAPESHHLESRATTVVDSDTGFTFSESKAATTLSSNIIYRVAVPANVPANQPYDVVLQVIAPNSVGWAGLAWGGGMIRNPLTVAYSNGQKPTVSSRWATGHSTPQSYTGATYTYLTKGNKSNGTHWQYTVRCKGCTTFTGSSGQTRIDPTSSSSRLAYAAANAKASSPSSNTSTIPVHDVYNYFTHNFAAGTNQNFATLLQNNGVASSGAETGNSTAHVMG